MSKIQVCFIPPRGLEANMSKSYTVMALAQLATDDKGKPTEYAQTIRRLAKFGRTIIVDNGAAEGVRLSFEQLEDNAKTLAAHELVLPDVLHNAEETLDLVREFLVREDRYWFDSYMAVVQGNSAEECQKLIEEYSRIRRISTLGLPRLLITEDHRARRIDLARWVEEAFPKRFKLHLLGASSIWPKEPYFAERYKLGIRSIDTSLPYNYGLSGIRIDATTKKIDRPDGYFTRTRTQNQLTTVAWNEEVYKRWCAGIL